MEIDRRAFFATLGSAAVINAMPDEAKAEALEHYMTDLLDQQTTGNELLWRPWGGGGGCCGGDAASAAARTSIVLHRTSRVAPPSFTTAMVIVSRTYRLVNTP